MIVTDEGRKKIIKEIVNGADIAELEEKYDKEDLIPLYQEENLFNVMTTGKIELTPKGKIYLPSAKKEDLPFFSDSKFVPLLMAQHLMNDYNFTTHEKTEELYVYENGVYKPKGEAVVKRESQRRLGKYVKTHHVNETLEAVRRANYTPPERFNNPEDGIVVENGILDTDKRGLRDHSPEYIHLTKIPWKYDPNADCPKIKKFISEIVNEGDEKLIQEMFGYCLLKDYPYAKAFMLLGAGANGKCQAKGDKVLMADGEWKNIEEIKKGDTVISPQEDGSTIHAKVKDTNSWYAESVYQIKDKKGKILYTCSGNHNIPIIRTYTKRTSKDDSTPRKREKRLFHYKAEKLEKLNNDKSFYVSFSTPPIKYNKKDSSIDPYCLGAWLGDGYFSKKQTSRQLHRQLGLTTKDEEIIEEFKKKYPKDFIATQAKKGSKAKTYRFSLNGEFSKELTRLGLDRKGSGDKFIPKECLSSSIDYRKNLLGGIIDTDGFVAKTGAIWVTTKSEYLADNIKELVFSLGGYASIRKIEKSCGDFTGNYYEVSVQFKNYKKILPLRTWKKERLKTRKRNPRHVAVECEKTEPQKVYGIEVDSPSHWYITNNWMVTHNSTLLTLLEKFLGEDNTANPALQELLGTRFAKIELFGKLANIHADLSSKKLESTGTFKMLTGNDKLRGEKKYQNAVKFENYAKLIYSANELPKTTDRTDAFFRRWIVIDFPHQFPENSEDTNPDLPDSIITEKEMSGLLNWALDGLDRIREQGGFSQTRARQDIKQKWIMQTDSLRGFLQIACEVKRGAWTVKKDFQNLYKEFCNENNIYSVKKGQVTKRLPTIKPVVSLYRPELGFDSRPRCWRNLKIKKSFIEEHDYCSNLEKLRTSSISESDKTSEKMGLNSFTDSAILDEIPDSSEKPIDIDLIIDSIALKLDLDMEDDRDKIENWINELIKNGEVYEPREGRIKKV